MDRQRALPGRDQRPPQIPRYSHPTAPNRGRCARPWDAGVLAEVAEGCVGTDAAAAEACCAAWSALVLTGGGARRLADRRPALLERTRDLAPRLAHL